MKLLCPDQTQRTLTTRKLNSQLSYRSEGHPVLQQTSNPAAETHRASLSHCQSFLRLEIHLQECSKITEDFCCCLKKKSEPKSPIEQINNTLQYTFYIIPAKTQAYLHNQARTEAQQLFCNIPGEGKSSATKLQESEPALHIPEIRNRNGEPS